MIKIAPNIWIGDSDDEKKSECSTVPLDCVLVVAHDMKPENGWEDGIEYMQVGLIDGPGNLLATYHAAVLSLAALVKKGKTLVCCHDGGRSLAIGIMYLYLMGEGPSWDEVIKRLKIYAVVNSSPNSLRTLPSIGVKGLPKVHASHRKAFFMIDWGMLTRVLDKEVTDEC